MSLNFFVAFILIGLNIENYAPAIGRPSALDLGSTQSASRRNLATLVSTPSQKRTQNKKLDEQGQSDSNNVPLPRASVTVPKGPPGHSYHHVL